MYPLALFYSAELPLVLSLPYTPITYYGGFCCSSMLKQVNTCLPFLQLLNYSKPPTAVGPQSAICIYICCCFLFLFLTKCSETFTKATTTNNFAFFVKKDKRCGVYCYRKWRHIPSECVVPCACGLHHRNWIAIERKTKAYKEIRRGTSSLCTLRFDRRCKVCYK